MSRCRSTEERIDNAPLREAFVRSGRSASGVARAVWGDEKDHGSTRLKRALGIKPDVSWHGRYKIYRRTIRCDTALKIAEELELDPREIDL